MAELARLAGVSVPTIVKVERYGDRGGVRPKTIDLIRQALIRAGATLDGDSAVAEPKSDGGGLADSFEISGVRFRKARLTTGMRPRDLIALTGLTHPTLKAVERGEGPPRVARETVLKIVGAYRRVGYHFGVNAAADHMAMDQFDWYYHECDPDRLAETPAEALAKLERLCGALPETFVREFWARVEQFEAQRAQASPQGPG